MSRYGTIIDPSTAVVAFVQAADAEEMTALASAAIQAIPATNLITAIDLAGAGDGHTFVLMIEHAPVIIATPPLPVQNVTGGFSPLVVSLRFYLAGDAEELGVARSALALAGQTIEDEIIAGAAKGTRVMGCVVRGLSQAPLSQFRALNTAFLATTQMMPPTSGIVLVDTLGLGGGFDNPNAGELRYSGPSPIAALVDVSVSFSIETTSAPSPVRAEAVLDPLGAANLIQGAYSYATPDATGGEVHNVSVTTVVVALNPEEKLGIRMIIPPSFTNINIWSAQIRAAQLSP